MKVRGVELDDDGHPAAVNVWLSVREAALIVRMIGKTNGTERNAVQSDGAEVGTEIYQTLTGLVFCPYHEDGMDEVPR